MLTPDTQIFSKAAPELVKRIRDGEASAFELFYRMEYLNLVHFADSYLHDTERARDISQESMMTLWRNRERLDPEKNIRALLYTIARNKTLDEIRRRRFFSPSDGTCTLESVALEDRSAEDYISRLDLSALMEKVWNSLPEKTGRTFRLSREDKLKNKEIALREGVSEKTVEYRIRVALKQFKKVFQHIL